LPLLEQSIKDKIDYKHIGIITEFAGQLGEVEYCKKAELQHLHRKPKEISYDFHKSNVL
jgi:hypothetical protein